MVQFAEVNHVLSPYLMLQDIGRVARKLVPRHCLRYLQTTLITGEGDWSQNFYGVFQADGFIDVFIAQETTICKQTTYYNTKTQAFITKKMKQKKLPLLPTFSFGNKSLLTFPYRVFSTLKVSRTFNNTSIKIFNFRLFIFMFLSVFFWTQDDQTKYLNVLSTFLLVYVKSHG